MPLVSDMLFHTRLLRLLTEQARLCTQQCLEVGGLVSLRGLCCSESFSASRRSACFAKQLECLKGQTCAASLHRTPQDQAKPFQYQPDLQGFRQAFRGSAVPGMASSLAAQAFTARGLGAGRAGVRRLASEAASGQQVIKEPEARHRQGYAGWVLVAPAIFAAFLGCWQVNRRAWKVDLLEQRAKALQAEVVPLFNSGEAPEEYTRVMADGIFAHDRSVCIGPRPRSVMGTALPGYTLVTPLLAEEWGKAALVLRGWVPAAWRSDPATRAPHEPSGKVCIEGIVRASERPSMFVPANHPSEKEFFWIDVPALASACGLPEDTPLIEAVDPGSKSVGGRGTIPSQMDVLAMRTQGRAGDTHSPEPLPIIRKQSAGPA